MLAIYYASESKMRSGKMTRLVKEVEMRGRRKTKSLEWDNVVMNVLGMSIIVGFQ